MDFQTFRIANSYLNSDIFTYFINGLNNTAFAIVKMNYAQTSQKYFNCILVYSLQLQPSILESHFSFNLYQGVNNNPFPVLIKNLKLQSFWECLNEY